MGFGQAVEPHDVLVVGQDQFLPPARDIIWDCRAFPQGLPAVPLDFDAPVSSDLSTPYIQRALATWPDQELLGFLIDGVDFKADLPLQIVLGPQLVSLSKAYPNAQKEIERLHAGPPTGPGRAVARLFCSSARVTRAGPGRHFGRGP